ncbi:MAG: ATP-binding protein [Clostridiales bacterium]
MIEHKKAFQDLDGLVLYREILSSPLITAFRRVWQTAASAIADKQELLKEYCLLVEQMLGNLDRLPWTFQGEGWTALMVMELLHQENLFSLWAEKGRILPAKLQSDQLTQEIIGLAARDLKVLGEVARISQQELANLVGSRLGVPESALPSWNLPGLCSSKPAPPQERQEAWRYFLSDKSWAEGGGILAEYYRTNGAGRLGRYYAFRWQTAQAAATNAAAPAAANKTAEWRPADAMLPVISRDPIRFSQLSGYEREHQKLIQNTQQFLAGLPANNVLLYGDRGTGKSSAVKALLNEYGPKGLRLVEMTKAQLPDLPYLLEELKERGLHFIIFIDDLSFLEQDSQYAALKAVLEGGIAVKPDNVLIYATSNRRHLLPEKFQDRQIVGDEDLRTGDTLQEKLSLADRFGMTITFLSPDQKGYLRIVEELAAARQLPISKEALERRALEWEIRQNLRSPRTARQFVDHLTGELQLESGQ